MVVIVLIYCYYYYHNRLYGCDSVDSSIVCTIELVILELWQFILNGPLLCMFSYVLHPSIFTLTPRFRLL
jgi:hypothetical protein